MCCIAKLWELSIAGERQGERESQGDERLRKGTTMAER